MVLNTFASLLPGDTYKKKLFYWNLIQYVGFFLWGIGHRLLLGDISATNPIMWWVDLMVTYLFTNDGHIYGDLVYVAGLELRWLIWPFSLLAVVILSCFWAFRGSGVAKYLRILSYLVALISYLIWTTFFTWDPRYDYYFWAQIIVTWNYNLLVILLGALSILAMWFGPIISTGYLIYKAWKEG